MRPRRRLCVVIAAAACAQAAAAPGEYPAQVVVRPQDARGAGPIPPEQLRSARATLEALGFETDRCGHDPAAGTISLDLQSGAERERLTLAGFAIVAEEAAEPAGGLRVDAQYYDPADIAALLAQVAAEYPEITHLFSIGTTYQSRPIWALEISDHPGEVEDEPAVQLNAQHHARELATSHIVMDAVMQLTSQYGIDPDITGWVDNYKTVCVPMVNPDGVDYVFNTYNGWRKNRQLHACYGVDLNRNYPYLWGPGCGSSGVCGSDIYRGPLSASERETQAMIGLADDYHFVIATSYHSYGRFIDYPYACATGAPATLMPEHAVIHETMNGMADAIDAVDSVPRYTVYSPVPYGGVNGDDTSWYYAHRGTYAYIVEVGTGFQPPFSDVAGIVNRNRAGWKYLYQRLGEARIDVHITDACSALPLEAEVTLTDYVFDTGELPRSTFAPYGRWTFLVPRSNTFTVRASRSGFITQDFVVPVGNAPAQVNIALARGSPPPYKYGDTDCDGDFDAADLERFLECLTGPVQLLVNPCALLDSNADLHIDLLDLAALQAS